MSQPSGGKTGDPGRLSCLDPATGDVLWTQEGFEKGGIIALDGEIMAFNGANGDLILVDLSPKAYHELGRFNPLGGQSWTAPVVAYGKLIVRNKTTLACLNLK
jgi:outer membrane protein assembly factor BamB